MIGFHVPSRCAEAIAATVTAIAVSTTTASAIPNRERRRHVRPRRPKARPSIAIASLVPRLIDWTRRTKIPAKRPPVRRARNLRPAPGATRHRQGLPFGDEEAEQTRGREHRDDDGLRQSQMLDERIREIPRIDRRGEDDKRDGKREGTDEDRRRGFEGPGRHEDRTEIDDDRPGLLREDRRAPCRERAPSGRNHRRLNAAHRSSPLSGRASAEKPRMTPAETMSMLSGRPDHEDEGDGDLRQWIARTSAVDRTTGMS